MYFKITLINGGFQMKKKRRIERNERGELIKWYGFWASADPSLERCYIDFCTTPEPYTVSLFLDGQEIANIDCYSLCKDNIREKSVVHTENEIVDYIYNECRKIVPHRKIYVDEALADIISVAGCFEDFMSEEELAVDQFFLEKELDY